MASTQNSNKFFSNNKMKTYRHAPGDTSANDVEWVDMRDYGRFVAATVASELTGNGVTAFTILANSESDGGGTDAEIKSHAVGSAPDAVGDQLYLECSAEEIRSMETSSTGQLRYASVSLTHDNNSDVSMVNYIRTEPRVAEDALTADIVA